MIERQSPHQSDSADSGHQPLIGVIVEEQGREQVRYCTDEVAADAALPDSAIPDARGAVGAFADLDWDEMEDTLDRIRHESKPTPPITRP